MKQKLNKLPAIKKHLSKITLIAAIVMLCSNAIYGQMSITALNTPATQNFTSLGTSGTAALPSGFVVSQATSFAGGTTATTAAYGSTGTGVVTGSSTGATVNWANGITGSSTERALGFLNSGGFTSPRSVMLQITNNSGSTINSLDINFDYEKYRSGSRAFNWTFFQGTDGTTWTANASGDQSYAADAANTTVYNPPLTTSKSFTITGLTIANGASYYLRWTFTGVGGSTNGQGMGIDNISVTGSAIPSGPTASVLSGTNTICTGASAALSVAITGGTSPYTVVLNDGVADFTVNSYTSGANISVSPAATTTYTLVSVTDASLTVGTGNSGNAVITVNAVSADIAQAAAGNTSSDVGSASATRTHADGTTVLYTNANCNPVIQITDAAGGNVLGSTTADVTVSAALPTDNTLQQYVPRYNTITSASSGAATVTMYLTQADFTSYNSLKGAYYKAAPTSGNNADPNIANIFLAHVMGGLVNGTITEIIPASLMWNAANNNWELTANTPDVNGDYYIYTKPFCSLMINYASLGSANITNVSAAISWDAVGGVFNNTYKIRYKPVAGGVWNGQTITGNSHTIVNLLPNTQYEYQVRVACSASEQGAYSSSKTFTTLANPCTTPTGIITSNISPNSVQFNWNAVAGAGSYSIRVRPSGNNWAGNTVAVTNSKVISNLTAATLYEYQLLTNCAGYPASSWSTTGTFTTLANPCTTPAGINTTNITANSVQFDWTAVAAASSYSIRVRPAGSNWAGNTVTAANSKVIGNLQSATSYEYQLLTNCTGYPASTWSAIGTFTTLANPCTTPTGIITSNITANSVQFTWTAVAAASSYSIRVRPVGNSWAGNTVAVTNTKVIGNLLSGTVYEYQLLTNCAGYPSSGWSTIATFTTAAPRFSPVASASISNFQGHITAGDHLLNWTSTNEFNNEGFNLLYSTDGQHFNHLSHINSKATDGNSTTAITYGYKHTTSEHTFYRIESVGMDGSKWQHNEILDLYAETKPDNSMIFPNPANDILNIQYFTEVPLQLTVKVLDMTGRLVKIVTADAQKGDNILKVSVKELVSGVYTIQIFTKDRMTHIEKIQKQD